MDRQGGGELNRIGGKNIHPWNKQNERKNGCVITHETKERTDERTDE